MKTLRLLGLAVLLLLVGRLSPAQTSIAIAAGSPEDKALQQITSEADMQKRIAMLEDFVQKFGSNPAAVAYGDWQLAQQYLTKGDRDKALAYGDKALVAMPDVVDILVMQVDVAQSLKDSPKVVDYAVRGATVISGIDKRATAAGVSAEEHARNLAREKATMQPSYRYLEVAGYNAVAAEQDPHRRLKEIEKYMGGFPASRFNERLATLAIVTLQQMKDSAGLAAFGDKMLAKNPDDVQLLTVLASAYANDPDHATKAGSYARKAIELEKSKPGADATSRKLEGVAHSVLGRALLQEGKFRAGAAELRIATELLKDSPEDLAGAWYYLGFAYAKMERAGEAVRALTSASRIQGPYQQPAQDLLRRIEAARRRRR